MAMAGRHAFMDSKLLPDIRNTNEWLVQNSAPLHPCDLPACDWKARGK